MDPSREYLIETWLGNNLDEASELALSLLVMYDHGLLNVITDDDGEPAFSAIETVSKEVEQLAEERYFSLISRPFGEIFSAVLGGTNQVN